MKFKIIFLVTGVVLFMQMLSLSATVNHLNPLIERSSFMPDCFWEELEKSNQDKSVQAPLALILQAEKDDAGAFSVAESRAQIFAVAKAHRVAFKIIGNQEHLREKIQKTKQQLDRPIDLLVICGHSSSDVIHLSKDNDYTVKDLCKEDFRGLSTKGKILLNSCSTGKLFAPQLARVTGLDVVAPTDQCFGGVTTFYSCEEHGFEMSCVHKGEQRMRVFHSRQEPTVPCIENPSVTETLEYLIQDAMLGDVRSQCSLGVRYLCGLGVEKSSDSAFYWLKKAADEGSIEACNVLGVWYFNKGEYDTAE